MSYQEHQKYTAKTVCCAVLTVSDTRTEANDSGGRLIQELLDDSGHPVCHYAIIKDDPERISEQLGRLRGDDRCQAVLITGGTGIAPRDHTFEVVAALLTKRLDGFGELFRMLSFDEIGSGAMLSRAVGGLIGRQVVFSMPGSINAVRLAMTRLILPELGHLVSEANRHAGG